jgi:hypothetical protein
MPSGRFFNLRRNLLLAAALALPLTPAIAASSDMIGDIVKAQIIINKVLEVKVQYDKLAKDKEGAIVLEAPEPVKGAGERYLLPHRADGELTAWAEKGLGATGKVGAAVGEKAGDAAGKDLASKVPFGGIAGGLMKSKGKEIGAMAGLSGADFVKANSELSFKSLNEYAVHLFVRHGGDSNYKEVLSVAMALYPDLGGRFQGGIQDAYKAQAAKAAKKVTSGRARGFADGASRNRI